MTEENPVEVETTTTEGEGVTVNVTIQSPEAAAENSQIVRTIPDASPDVLEDVPSDDVSLVMADAVRSVLGDYQRQTYTVQQVDANGTVISESTEYVPGLAGLDWEWIAGVLLFTIILHGFLRMVGVLLKR